MLLMAQAKRFYTLLQVSARLGVSPQTVQRWLDAGRLQGWRTLGGHRRIDADSADALIEAHTGLGTTAQVPVPVPAPVLSPPRILIVDDRPLDAALLQEHVLSVFPGAKLTLAGDGFEALMSIGSQPPDLVVVDLVMPHMNGVEMVRRLREKLDPAPALLIVSGLRGPGIAALGGLPEGVPLLEKPFDPEACRRLLRALLPRHVPPVGG
jgi:excisionase family DNA binding protein